MHTAVEDIELLAPAGRWEVLESVVSAGADAVYLGGKSFNMRLLRSDLNFSEQEIEMAVSYLHSKNKKIYITVNNLYYQDEIDAIKDYLFYLASLKVDALIIQDIGLLQLCKELELGIPLHASVQMGVANAFCASQLQQLGCTRAILSKNLSVEEIAMVRQNCAIGLEFFVHGDLCIAHAGQCFMSSFINSDSGNQGRCIKPCRWPYYLKNGSIQQDKRGYYLASKDLCLINHLEEIINAGITSLKIEGRMRDGQYLAYLVKSYREALDSVYENRKQNSVHGKESIPDYGSVLNANRVRDFTVANLHGKTDINIVDISGIREPLIFNEFVPFSEQSEITSINTPINVSDKVALRVSISNLDQLKALQEMPVDGIIVNSTKFKSNGESKYAELMEWIVNGNTKKEQLFWEVPRIMAEKDVESTYQEIERVAPYIKGIIANDLGAVSMAPRLGLEIHAGYGLKIANSFAVKLLKDLNVTLMNPALELNLAQMLKMAEETEYLELLIQGPLCGMISDTCIISNHLGKDHSSCQRQCALQDNFLTTESGVNYRIRGDENCRNYVYHAMELSMLPVLHEFVAKGLRFARIDAEFYDVPLLTAVVKIYFGYFKNINDIAETAKQGLQNLKDLFPDGFASIKRESKRIT